MVNAVYCVCNCVQMCLSVVHLSFSLFIFSFRCACKRTPAQLAFASGFRKFQWQYTAASGNDQAVIYNDKLTAVTGSCTAVDTLSNTRIHTIRQTRHLDSSEVKWISADRQYWRRRKRKKRRSAKLILSSPALSLSENVPSAPLALTVNCLCKCVCVFVHE